MLFKGASVWFHVSLGQGVFLYIGIITRVHGYDYVFSSVLWLHKNDLSAASSTTAKHSSDDESRAHFVLVNLQP